MDQKSEEALIEWASSWSDKFAQDWDEARLRSMVGKHVKAVTSDGKHGFEADVVGFSIDSLCVPSMEEDVHRYSFITNEGLQLAVLADMVVVEESESS